VARWGDLWVRSKADLSGGPRPGLTALMLDPALAEKAGDVPGMSAAQALKVSVRTGDGLTALEQDLVARVSEALGREEAPVLTRARHRRLVQDAQLALVGARAAIANGPEYAAEDVRRATTAIGRLTGRIDVEDLLGEIFSSFCIGK
jgi:tRNA modification GTPase